MTTARWSRAQRGGPIMLSLQPALLQAQAPINLGAMACHSLKRTQVDPPCQSDNLISYSMPASPIELINPLPNMDLNSARVLSPSGQQALWPNNSGLAH